MSGNAPSQATCLLTLVLGLILLFVSDGNCKLNNFLSPTTTVTPLIHNSHNGNTTIQSTLDQQPSFQKKRVVLYVPQVVRDRKHTHTVYLHKRSKKSSHHHKGKVVHHHHHGGKVKHIHKHKGGHKHKHKHHGHHKHKHKHKGKHKHKHKHKGKHKHGHKHKGHVGHKHKHKGHKHHTHKHKGHHGHKHKHHGHHKHKHKHHGHHGHKHKHKGHHHHAHKHKGHHGHKHKHKGHHGHKHKHHGHHGHKHKHKGSHKHKHKHHGHHGHKHKHKGHHGHKHKHHGHHGHKHKHHGHHKHSHKHKGHSHHNDAHGRNADADIEMKDTIENYSTVDKYGNKIKRESDDVSQDNSGINFDIGPDPFMEESAEDDDEDADKSESTLLDISAPEYVKDYGDFEEEVDYEDGQVDDFARNNHPEVAETGFKLMKTLINPANSTDNIKHSELMNELNNTHLNNEKQENIVKPHALTFAQVDHKVVRNDQKHAQTLVPQNEDWDNILKSMTYPQFEPFHMNRPA